MSAGNDGSGAFYHGSYNGLPVGASYLNTVEPYAGQFFTSAIGPMIDGRIYPKLIAVGENLTSAVPDQETTSVGSYGSSGAAAITAGTAALMLQAVPSLTNRQLRALLIDTASEVALGNSFAAGYGYLRSKRAVQAAQAGAASEGQIQGLVSYHWPVTLTQGEVFKSTLVWQQKPYLASDDLELILRAPNGLVVAESRGSQDTVEQVRIVADQTGTYELTLEAVSYSNPSNGLTYAITGVPATPASVTPNLCGALPQPTLLSLQQGKLSLPLWSGQLGAQPDTLFTVLKGCKLNQVTAARIGLTPVPFVVWSEKALRLTVPVTTPQGINIVTLDTPGGQIQGVLGLDDAPLLSAPYTVGTGDGGALTLKYKPNSAFAYLVSLSQTPTILPGFLNLAIGKAGADLTVMTIGSLNANGVFQQLVGGFSSPNLVGSKIYCQAALVDPDFPAIPLLTSNVATSLIIF
jgi:hypothetical protein